MTQVSLLLHPRYYSFIETSSENNYFNKNNDLKIKKIFKYQEELIRV